MNTKLMKRIAVFIFAVVFCGGWFAEGGVVPLSSSEVKAAASEVTLLVDSDTVVSPMKETIRGTNVGLWKSNEFHPVSNRKERYVNLLKEAGITMIRFPAGAESDNVYFDRSNTGVWYEGPGAYSRTMTAATLDSFIDLVQEVGAEPLITVNAKIDNKEMAADMVRYANIEKGYNIKYWEIGNEPEFFGGDYKVTALEYADRIMEYADAMKAVDPSIQIVGPANSQPLPFLTSWTKPILSKLHDHHKPVDAISLHWYPLDGYQSNPASSAYPSIDNLLAYEGDDWQNSYISWASKFTNTTPSDNLVSYRDQYAPEALIGITELGQVTAHGEGIADTLAGALWLGDVLGRFAYHEVDFVTQFLFQGNQTYALIDDNRDVRPAYYVYPLLHRYFGDEMVMTSSSDNQNLTIWASKKAEMEDKLYLMVINKHQTDAMSAEINLSNFNPRSTASSWVLSAPAVDSLTGANINGVEVASDGTLPEIGGNAITNVSGNFTHTFPAHSITMIELTAQSDSLEAARYLGQYADTINERKTASEWPGSVSNTPDGFGKIWKSGAGKWEVHFPETGEYEYRMLAYGEGTGSSYQIRIDGQNISGASAELGSSWQDYEGSLGIVTAGTHTIEIYNNSAGANNINIAHIDIVGAAPGAFQLMSPADGEVVESTSVTLDWTQEVSGRQFAPHGAADYTVTVADNAALSDPVYHSIVNSTSIQVGPLAHETTYYWQITANNANGFTVSETFTFTTPDRPLPARYLGQYADRINERRTAGDWPGNPSDTPYGKPREQNGPSIFL